MRAAASAVAAILLERASAAARRGLPASMRIGEAWSLLRLRRRWAIDRHMLDGDALDHISVSLQLVDDGGVIGGKLPISGRGLDLEINDEVIAAQAERRGDDAEIGGMKLDP